MHISRRRREMVGDILTEAAKHAAMMKHLKAILTLIAALAALCGLVWLQDTREYVIEEDVFDEDLV